MIKAEIVADSLDPRGNRLTSVLCTFPRIILAEVNTHRMLSKNTSSSRAIPFNKMVEAVETNPFIPIAWQKHHSGMQGNEYITDSTIVKECINSWLAGRDDMIEIAANMNCNQEVTKQLCNRLLEPFMWTTMLITGSKEGWDNFFNLRCPQYTMGTSDGFYKSRKDLLKAYPADKSILNNNLYWLSLNKGQAEIHIMDLAEKIYDAIQESTPKRLEEHEWHVPFEYTIDLSHSSFDKFKYEERGLTENEMNLLKVKVSTSLAARTSYTVVGDEKEIDYARMIRLHDRLISQDPPHSSPMEHCCLVVTEEEYNNSFKGREKGWFRNYKGFKSYREIIESSK